MSLLSLSSASPSSTTTHEERILAWVHTQATVAYRGDRPPAISQALQTVFHGEHGCMASFLSCAAYIMGISTLQGSFFRQLEQRNFIQDAQTDSCWSMLVVVSDANSQKFGSRNVRMEPFLERLCDLVLSVHNGSVHGWPRFPCISNIPYRLARAFLFFTTDSCVYPLRLPFLVAFLEMTSFDYRYWTDPGPTMRWLCTTTFLRLSYPTPDELGCFQDMGSAEVRALCDASTPDHCSIAGGDALMSRAAELQAPRMMLTLARLLLMRCMRDYDQLAAPHEPDRAEYCMSLLELTFAMLTGAVLRPDQRAMAARRLPRSAIMLLGGIAEEMRRFIREPMKLSAAEMALANELYLTSADFSGYEAVKRFVDNIMCTTSAPGRLHVHTRVTEEPSFSSFLNSLDESSQVYTFAALESWNRGLPSTCQIDFAGMRLSSMTATNTNNVYTVYRFHAHLSVSTLWASVRLYLNACPILGQHPERNYFIGVDYRSPFIVASRRAIEFLRIIENTYTALVPKSVRFVALFPLLAHMYTTTARNETDDGQVLAVPEGFSPVFPHLSLTLFRQACVVCIMAHSLKVPHSGQRGKHEITLPNGFVGVPSFPRASPNCALMGSLHTVCELLFRGQPPVNSTDGSHMPELNALRAFLMMDAAHTIDLGTLRTVAQVARDSNRVWLAEALFAIVNTYEQRCVGARIDSPLDSGLAAMGIAEPAAAAAVVAVAAPKKRGRSDSGRAKKVQVHDEPDRITVSLSAVSTATLSAENPLMALATVKEREAVLNGWLYDFAVNDMGSMQLLMALRVQTNISHEAYKKAHPMHPCPASAAKAWAGAATLMTEQMATDYVHMRDCTTKQIFTGGQPQSFRCLVGVLQQLELLTCIGSTQMPQLIGGSGTASYEQRQREIELIKRSSLRYESLSAVTESLPRAIDTYYRNSANRSVGNFSAVGVELNHTRVDIDVLMYSNALTMVDLRPPTNAPPPPDPRECLLTMRVVNFVAIAGDRLTQVEHITNPAIENLVMHQILESAGV